MAGRKTRYSPEIAERMAQIVEQTGQHKPAFEAVGLSERTFYTWLNKHPQFSQVIARAQQAFWSRDDEELINRCRAALIRHLMPHEEEWTSEETTTLPDGSEVVKVSKKTVLKAPSEWAVKLVTPMLSGAPAGAEQILAKLSGTVEHEHIHERREQMKGTLDELAARRRELAG